MSDQNVRDIILIAHEDFIEYIPVPTFVSSWIFDTDVEDDFIDAPEDIANFLGVESIRAQLFVSSGSPENDKALFIGREMDGYPSIKDLLEGMKENGYVLGSDHYFVSY